MSKRYLPFYFILLIPSALVVLSIWYFFVDGTLYYCSDKAPLIDFIPPFVHSIYGDRFIASPVVIYVLWITLILTGFIAPLFFMEKVMREFKSQTSSKLHTHVMHEK